MKPWIQIDPADGRILMGGNAPDAESLSHLENVIFDSPIEFSKAHYIDTSTMQPVEMSAQPGPHYVWDWATHTWVLDAQALATDLLTQVQTLRNMGTFAPITFAGNPFDADPEAREAISQTYASIARGEGLPDGWEGWRDANNVMQWADALAITVGSHLKAIMKSIIDRHQALMSAGWAHTDAIRALLEAEDSAGLLAHDVTTGWP